MSKKALVILLLYEVGAAMQHVLLGIIYFTRNRTGSKSHENFNNTKTTEDNTISILTV